MSKMGNSKGKGRFAPIVLAVTGLALAAPGAGLAVGSTLHQTSSSEAVEYLPFTPAGVDPALAQKVADLVGEDALQFTPANRPRAEGERSVNFAVRVNSDLARSISGRPARDTLAKATVTDRLCQSHPRAITLALHAVIRALPNPPANRQIFRLACVMSPCLICPVTRAIRTISPAGSSRALRWNSVIVQAARRAPSKGPERSSWMSAALTASAAIWM